MCIPQTLSSESRRSGQGPVPNASHFPRPRFMVVGLLWVQKTHTVQHGFYPKVAKELGLHIEEHRASAILLSPVRVSPSEGTGR